jgi:carbon storage regulator
MLVLTRQFGQAIVIDGKIRVTLLGEHQGKVRVGIEAPREVIVDREEIARLRLLAPRQPELAARHSPLATPSPEVPCAS